MKKSLLAVGICFILSNQLFAADGVKQASTQVDPFSGHELELERLNKELILQKAINATLKEELSRTNVEAEIKTNSLKGEYEQKKIKRDTAKLDDAAGQNYSPSLPSMTIVPPANAIGMPTPVAPAAEVAKETAQPKKMVKKEEPKRDVLLGAIQFGNEKPSYLIETHDGKYSTSTELDPKLVQKTPSGYYTTVSESDVYQPGSGDASNPFGRRGGQAPFGNSSAPTPGSIPITVPQLQSPSGNGMMPPQGLNHVPTVVGY
jgi:hypothetical protein